MKSIKKIVFWAILLSCPGIVAAEVKLKVLTEEFAPFNYIENGKVTGFATEIVQELIKTTSVSIERDKVLVWPWKRAYQVALEEDNVLLFVTTRTLDRENLFKWVGPVYPRHQWLFKLRSRKDIRVTSFENAKSFKVAEVEESANYQTFIKHGFTPGEDLVIVNTWQSKIQMLIAGRVDLASFLPLELAYRMKQLGEDYHQFEKLFLASGDFEYYLAFSKGSSDEIVDQFQNAFNTLKKNGFYDKILKKYMN